MGKPWERDGVRVIHFTDTYLPRRDGVITSIRTLVDALTAGGHRALTVVPRHPDQPSDQPLLRLRALPCGPAGLRVSPWLLRGAAADGSLAAIAAEAPDVIHVHTPGPIGLLGVLAARRLGVPLVHSYHTDLHAYAEAYRLPARVIRVGVRLIARRLDVPRPPVRRDNHPNDTRHSGLIRRSGARLDAIDACNRLLLGDSDAVVVPTRAVLDRIRLPVPDDQVVLVPSGVGARPATPADVAGFRETYGLARDDRVLLFVGRVNREKGIDLLVDAFARIVAQRPTTRLVMVGARYEPRWFAALLRRIGPAAAARITWTGEQPTEVVAAAYGAAEVFVFGSLTDTQALVLQEAALAGVPTVLADPVLHRHGALGGAGICAGQDPAAFAAAVVGLLDDPARARRVGREAARRAAEHTPARYAAAILDVYAEARDRRDARLTPQVVMGR